MLPGGPKKGTVTWLPVGLASGVLALALSRGSIFAPLRALARGWVAEFLTCWLCLGAWAAAGLTALQGPGELAWPVAWGAAWGVSSLLAAAVDRMAGE